MNKIGLILCIIFSTTFSFLSHAEIINIGDSSIHKLNDNYYTAKINDRDLWLVMERVTEKNYDSWLNYANVQGNSMLRRYMDELEVRGNMIHSGSGMFLNIFRDVITNKNFPKAIWVAYITAEKNPQPNNHKFDGYTVDTSHPDGYNPEDRPTIPLIKFKTLTPINQMKMFVTITNPEESKITSHMGISVTLESNYFDQEKDLSSELHSFAAKVVLSQDPTKRYMVNTPTTLMEKIIAQRMPAGSVFIGTTNMYEKQKNMEEKLNKMTEDDYKKSKDYSEWQSFESYKSNLLLPFDFICSQFFNNPIHQRQDDEKKIIRQKCLETFKEKFPPILTTIDKTLIINGPYEQNLGKKLVISREDHNQGWILVNPYSPDLDTHYIAVDLKAMANARKTEVNNLLS